MGRSFGAPLRLMSHAIFVACLVLHLVTVARPAAFVPSNVPSAEVRQAMLLKNAGHTAKAEAILRTVLHLHPDDLPARDELGLVLQAQGRREEALTQFQDLLKRDPSNAGVYSNMGICLEAMGRDEDALAAFKKALELKPNLRSAHVDLANYYRYHHHPRKAVTHLKRAIAITPGDPIAHGGLGAVYSDQEEWAKAEAQYRALLAIAPRNVHGITELGNVLLRQGHLKRAIARFKSALSLSQNTWIRAMDGLARAYREKGDFTNAEKYAKEAVKKRPVDTVSRDVLASVFQAEGHSRQAAQQYAAALRYDPSDEVANARLPVLFASRAAPHIGKDMARTHFPAVDLTGPNRAKGEPEMVQGEDEYSSPFRVQKDHYGIKELLLGVVLLFALCVCAMYLGCCTCASNEIAKPGYTPISNDDNSENIQLSGKEHLYEL